MGITAWLLGANRLLLALLATITLGAVYMALTGPHTRHIDTAVQNEGKLLCWVMTYPKNHHTRAKAVKDTWGPRCDILLFMSTTLEPSLPTVALPVPECRKCLWEKTKAAFRYLHEHEYLSRVDWILKTDDDTYVVVENLREMLGQYSPFQALLLGLQLKKANERGFMSGGAGYVVSRHAAQLLATRGLSGLTACTEDDGEDTGMARCLLALNTTLVDTRDADGKERFYAYPPERYLHPEAGMDWIERSMIHAMARGPQCCSRTPTTFHYVSPSLMRTLDYLLYRVKVLGMDSSNVSSSPLAS